MLLLIIIYIVFIALGLPDSAFGAAWPVMHVDFGMKESFASVYSVIIGLCTGGSGFFAGKLLRRFGTARVTFVSVLMTAAALFGISMSPNMAVAVLFAVILGYGAGAIDTGLNNYVSLHYKARHMSWLHCFWGIGIMTSPLILSVFLDKNEPSSWRNGYRVVAIILLAIGALVGIFLKKWIKTDSEYTAEVENNGAKVSIKKILKIKGVVPSILSLGFYCGMEFTFSTWGATFFVNSFATDPAQASAYVSLYFGGIMLGRLLSGFLSAKMSDSRLIFTGLSVAAVGLAVLILPWEMSAAAGIFITGLGFGPVFPSVLHTVPARFGKAFSADITGLHMTGAYAFGFVFQMTIGYISSNISFKIMPFALLVLCACAISAAASSSQRPLRRSKDR